MAKVSEFYGGTYITGADLAGRTHRLQVDRVEAEEVGDEREKKLVVYFANAKKALVLNKTNASSLVSQWSDETDEWPGRWLEAFTVPVTFNGRVYDGVRVRPLADQTSSLIVDTPAPVAKPASPAHIGGPASADSAAPVTGAPTSADLRGAAPTAEEIPF